MQRFVTLLGLSPADYQATTSVGSKRSQKRVKDEILGRFQNFQGIFWAERLESTESAVNQQEILLLLIGYADNHIEQLCRDMIIS